MQRSTVVGSSLFIYLKQIFQPGASNLEVAPLIAFKSWQILYCHSCHWKLLLKLLVWTSFTADIVSGNFRPDWGFLVFAVDPSVVSFVRFLFQKEISVGEFSSKFLALKNCFFSQQSFHALPEWTMLTENFKFLFSQLAISWLSIPLLNQHKQALWIEVGLNIHFDYCIFARDLEYL